MKLTNYRRCDVREVYTGTTFDLCSSNSHETVTHLAPCLEEVIESAKQRRYRHYGSDICSYLLFKLIHTRCKSGLLRQVLH